MQFPILIGLHRSRFLDIGILAIALAACASILSVQQPVISPLVFLTTTWAIAARAWQKLAPKFSTIRLERDGRLSVRSLGENEFFTAELLPGATVHPWLSVIKLKTAVGDAFVIITVDSLNRQNFRRLRVFLRWHADFNATKDDA